MNSEAVSVCFSSEEEDGWWTGQPDTIQKEGYLQPWHPATTKNMLKMYDILLQKFIYSLKDAAALFMLGNLYC